MKMKLNINRIIKLILIIFSLMFIGISSLTTKKAAMEETFALGTVFEFLKATNGSGAEPAASGAAPAATNNTNAAAGLDSPSKYLQDLNDPNLLMADWLSISSPAFLNPRKYPELANAEGGVHKIKFGLEKERMNEKYDIARSEGSPTAFSFWFKIRGGYLYYFATKDDINVLGAILANKVENSIMPNKHSNQTQSCFDLYDNEDEKYEICGQTMEIKLKWMCSLQQFLKQAVEWDCYDNAKKVGNITLTKDTMVEVEKITQPVIIIPMASKQCNENWNYMNKGVEWECTCADGKEQSPIDLPTKEQAMLSNLVPLFQYEMVSAKATETTMDGYIIAGEYVKIRYDRNAIRIHHPNMGKIVTLDGGVFQAEEIIFHTPSEHQINGEVFDLEMQVVHYGKTKGDIASQKVLSFLFRTKPGVYNKFIDKLDFFNLPNPTDTFRDIMNDFFIPSVFYTTDDDDFPTMRPFSFYTYQGSLTYPPCTERTVHYVAADPINISNTIVQLFKEAIRVPDMMNEKGDIIESPDGELKNNREIQPLNGRIVYIYDHIRFNCPEFKKIKRNIKPTGHYEKRDITVTQYIYVNSDAPSGIPDSYVVSENEAKGEADKPIIGETNDATTGQITTTTT